MSPPVTRRMTPQRRMELHSEISQKLKGYDFGEASALLLGMIVGAAAEMDKQDRPRAIHNVIKTLHRGCGEVDAALRRGMASSFMIGMDRFIKELQSKMQAGQGLAPRPDPTLN